MNKNNSLLVVKNLRKVFKTGTFWSRKQDFVAVNGVSFELKEGEILGLLGPNGAGKTTIIQMLLNLLTPSSGYIEYFGKDFSVHTSEIMQKISFASSYLKLPGSLTIEENLNLFGKLYGLTREMREAYIEKNIEFFGLTKIRNNLTRNISAGQLTRLMLAKAFLPGVKIVLLDEPTAALDPDIALQIRQFITHEIKALGISILFTSHNMAEVEEVCDRVLILKEGNIIASETPENLVLKVRTAHVQLLVSQHIEKLKKYLQENQIVHKFDKNFADIEIDEQKIGQFLYEIANLEIKFSQITIDKPTLEDYFLLLAKK